MASSIDFDIQSKPVFYDSTTATTNTTNTGSLRDYFDQTKRKLTEFYNSARSHVDLSNAMHATLLIGTILAAATAVMAYPRASQRPLAATDNPRDTWDSSFSDTCSKEGFFRSPISCQQFHRCARTIPGSSELVRYQFECPADQIYCPSQIACVHPWACSEPCRDSDLQNRGGNRPSSNIIKKGGKTCRPFVCERPGTFVDPLNCGRFQECESIFVDGDIKLLQTHGDCPKGEIFCSIVGACGKEEACPQKCDRTCTVV